MRVKFGKDIFICTNATHNEGSNLLILATNNGVYVVHMVTVKQAEHAHKNLLVYGYLDATDFEYNS